MPPRPAILGPREATVHELQATESTTITVRPSRPTLCIHLLGTRQAERDGLPLAAAAAQRKPMDLLVLLAAHPACKLPVAQVIDQLWPSLEMDAPRAALDMAVSRLRKLLGQPRAVAIVDGRVQLNEALVWSDVAEFQRLLDAAGRCPDGRERQATTEQALDLYRGPLLGHDRVHGLLAVQREALALRWLHALLDLGETLQQQGLLAQAVRCYRRALAADPLCEPLYRALIALYGRLGEPAQALHLYRACTVALREGLGVPPAEATRSLVQPLQRA